MATVKSDILASFYSFNCKKTKKYRNRNFFSFINFF